MVAGSPFVFGILNPGPVAIDATGNIWALNSNANLGVLTSLGSPVAGAPYNTSSSSNSSKFALDGLGNAWIVTRAPSGNPQDPFFSQIVGFSNSGNTLSGSSGYLLSNNVQQVNAIALDGSGNIWLDTSSSLTELVGAATPVVTPAVTGAVNNAFATRPGPPQYPRLVPLPCTVPRMVHALELASRQSDLTTGKLPPLDFEVVVSGNAASSMP